MLKGEGRDWHSVLHFSQFVHFLEGQLITLEVKKSVQDTLFKSEMGADMTVWVSPGNMSSNSMEDTSTLCYCF